ncbi:hypothetical protein ABZS83_38020, partial [Streptomyces sp. NPDC005426]|uniref:hypothetical protein n=1 Tax=Streptomyces sp. NPDC005426 TaxID=3155344 RepID=UPI0033BEA9BD
MKPIISAALLLIKSNQPKGKATSMASGIQIGPETERIGSGKVETAGKENAKAVSSKARPASTGNRTRKSLIESETQDRREAPGGKPERV